jgi:hypothetical protein
MKLHVAVARWSATSAAAAWYLKMVGTFNPIASPKDATINCQDEVYRFSPWLAALI